MQTGILSRAGAVRRVLARALMGAWLIGAMGAASAYDLTVTPATQTTGLGSEISIAVTAADLVPGALGGYSFDLSFEGSVLGFDRVVDGFGMGANSFGLSYALSGNTLSFADTSFDDPATLLSLQGPSFTLFTVYFDAVGAGTSFLALSGVTLADAFGNGVDFTSYDGSVTVESVVTPVPEPGTLPLLALGGLALMWVKRRNQRARSRA